jgi:hypothetical protein
MALSYQASFRLKVILESNREFPSERFGEGRAMPGAAGGVLRDARSVSSGNPRCLHIKISSDVTVTFWGCNPHFLPLNFPKLIDGFPQLYLASNSYIMES